MRPLSEAELVNRSKAERFILDQPALDAINEAASLIGLIRAQDGIGWHRPFFVEHNEVAQQYANGVDVRLGRTITSEEMTRLQQALDAEEVPSNYPHLTNNKEREAELTRRGVTGHGGKKAEKLLQLLVESEPESTEAPAVYADQYFVASTAGGARIIRYMDPAAAEKIEKDLPGGESLTPMKAAQKSRVVLGGINEAFREVVRNIVDSESVFDNNVESDTYDFHAQSDMVGNDWKDNPNGESYTSRLRKSGRSDVYGRLLDDIATAVERVRSDFSERYGWGDPGTVPRLDTTSGRAAIARSGFRSSFGGSRDGRGERQWTLVGICCGVKSNSVRRGTARRRSDRGVVRYERQLHFQHDARLRGETGEVGVG